jgi:enamine deaminase RidA (YjgF/YER057c/UK114 family)
MTRTVIQAGPTPGGPYSPAIAAGGLIFVSGILADDDDGHVEGGISEQTRVAIDRLSSVLAAAGSDLAHTLTVHVYLRHAGDFAAMNAVYQTAWGAEPPSRTTVVADLLGEGTLIEITAVAVPRGASRRAIAPDGWADSPLPYSYGVRAGDTVYLSGLVARDRHTNAPVPGGVRQQLDLIMANARDILAATGLTLEHVASARVFLTDAETFGEMNEGWRAHFPDGKPTRATVVAGLMNPAYGIEVTMVAHAAPPRRIAADPPSSNLSGVIASGSTVFLSGMLARGAGDVEAQTRAILVQAREALARAGATTRDVVEAVVYLPELAHFDAMNTAWRECFGEAPPARATIGASLLAGDAAVEVAMTAIVDG